MYEKKTDLISSLLELQGDFVLKQFNSEKANEYSKHGLSRRLRMLVHLVDRVFEAIPPDLKEIPSEEARHDVEAFIQSFLVNVYGAIDNMARIWCAERELKNERGNDIPESWIGLGPDNAFVRRSLPDEFQSYLKECDAWFGYLKNYRHAVAHRIPIYVPPTTLGDDDREAAEELQRQQMEAQASGDSQRVFELIHRLSALGKFVPLMMHSYGESAKPVFFHGQMICDIATVLEIGTRMHQAFE